MRPAWRTLQIRMEVLMNRRERRKARATRQSVRVHVVKDLTAFTTDGRRALFWFEVPEGIPADALDHAKPDFSRITHVEPGITVEFAGHTIELHGPFWSEAEMEDSKHLVLFGRKIPITEGGELSDENFRLLTKGGPSGLS
jgi:hypothetical protein